MEAGTTTTLIPLLTFLAGSLPALVLLYLRERMHQEREREWMRIFSVKSLEIPQTSMDASAPKEQVAVKAPDLRPRRSIPVPVSDAARQMYKAAKQQTQ